MWWIIVVSIIGGLIVLGILLSSIPFDLTFRFEFYNKPVFELRWAWFFGLLRRNIKPGRRKLEKKKARRKFNLFQSLGRIRDGLEFLQIKGLITQFITFVKKVVNRFKIRELEAEFNVGLDDPSETFYLFAITESVNQVLRRVQPYPVSIRTSFEEPVFEGYARCSVRIYPILLGAPAMQFIFSPPVFRLMKKMVAARWKRSRLKLRARLQSQV